MHWNYYDEIDRIIDGLATVPRPVRGQIAEYLRSRHDEAVGRAIRELADLAERRRNREQASTG
jgi:hypothetical protein